MKLLDMHCDTMLRIFEAGGTRNLVKNDVYVDEEKLLAGNSLAQFFAMYIDLKEIKEPFQVCNQMIEGFEEELKKCTKLKKACSYQDIIENEKNGFMSAVITIEEGGAIEGTMGKLYSVYDRGVRAITLTWNYPNEIGYPNYFLQYAEKGLTPFGKDMVGEMERLGMIPDASHLSDAGFYDLIDICKKPFIATHSNCRTLCGHARNLTDDMIRKLAEKGGVSGLNYESTFLVEQSEKIKELTKRISTGNSPENDKLLAELEREAVLATKADIVRHGLHMIKIGGEDFPAIGGDLDGTMSPAGFQHVGETLQLADAFHEAGLTWNQVEKIMYKNAMRVIKDTL